MRTARSAIRTCSAAASASEYTATLSRPASRHARMIRTAISPRLAISTRFIRGGESATLPGPCRPALFEERPHPFLTFGRDAPPRDDIRCQGCDVGGRAASHAREERFRLSHGFRARRQQLADVTVDDGIEVPFG